MPDFSPVLRDWLRPDRPPRAASELPRATSRAIAAVQHRTIVRTAMVQGESAVQTAKVKELASVGREAMSSHALLASWGATLARNDLLLGDDLRFFQDMVKLGMGEIVADTVDTYCRESRGQ